MHEKPRDFKFEIDDLNNDCISSNFTRISLGKEEYMMKD